MKEEESQINMLIYTVIATELIYKFIVTGNFDWPFKWINFSDEGLSFILVNSTFSKGLESVANQFQ